MWKLAAAGGFAGIGVSGVLTPVEFVKCRMQALAFQTTPITGCDRCSIKPTTAVLNTRTRWTAY